MPEAIVIDITTRRRIPEGESDAMALPRTLATRAAEQAADPQVIPHPDQELIGLCERAIELRNIEDRQLEIWRGLSAGTPRENRAWLDRIGAARRATRSPMLRASKLAATTAAGVYAKALAVHRIGPGAAKLAASLANDIVACVELRRVLWAADLFPCQPDAPGR